MLKILKKFSKFMQNIVNFILLLPVYFIGVGIVSIVSKCFNKKYLDNNKKWIKRDKKIENNDYRMF